jgi:hypothetical protein
VGLGRIEPPTSALSVRSMCIWADIDEQSQQIRAFCDPQRTGLNRSARAMDARSRQESQVHYSPSSASTDPDAEIHTRAPQESGRSGE